MITSFSRVLIIATLCLSLGFHWITLQSVAWGMMIVKYSQDCPLPEAVAKTFDGQHPCNLCKHISKQQHVPKKPEAQPTVGKPDLICAAALRTNQNAGKEFGYLLFDSTISKRSDAPVIPPPRRLG